MCAKNIAIYSIVGTSFTLQAIKMEHHYDIEEHLHSAKLDVVWTVPSGSRKCLAEE